MRARGVGGVRDSPDTHPTVITFAGGDDEYKSCGTVMVNVVINTFRGPVHVSDVVLHVVDFELRPPIILGVDLWRRFGVDVEAAIMGPLHDAVVQQGRVPAGAALAAVSVTRDESHAGPLGGRAHGVGSTSIRILGV